MQPTTSVRTMPDQPWKKKWPKSMGPLLADGVGGRRRRGRPEGCGRGVRHRPRARRGRGFESLCPTLKLRTDVLAGGPLGSPPATSSARSLRAGQRTRRSPKASGGTPEADLRMIKYGARLRRPARCLVDARSPDQGLAAAGSSRGFPRSSGPIRARLLVGEGPAEPGAVRDAPPPEDDTPRTPPATPERSRRSLVPVVGGGEGIVREDDKAGITFCTARITARRTNAAG